MITTNGKSIVAKYLLNQAPEFASHIAIGVGGRALSTSSSVTFASDADSLEFEVARVPILSKGLLKEDGQEKIVFKAELPIEQRYQITEIGLYPANNNAVAQNYDSKVISSFNNIEPWTYSNNLNDSGTVLYIGPLPIDGVNIGSIDSEKLISYSAEYFSFIDNNSPIFEYAERLGRGEEPRYLSRSMLVAGNTSVVSDTSASSSVVDTLSPESYYVQNNSINLNLGKNLPTDQIKFAFSVISKERAGVGSVSPNSVKIRLEFLNNTSNDPPKAYVDMSIFGEELEEQEMRYNVITKNISDFTTSANFSWSAINSIRIYSCIHDDSNVPSTDHYIIYDGIRFENISSYNPLYALVAAEYMKTQDQSPILKKENSTSYVEYRFGVGVS
jgi:hypothetical protein